MSSIIILLHLLSFAIDSTGTGFKNLANGVEYRSFKLSSYSEYEGEIHIVRINPNKVKPEVFTSKEHKLKPMTAKEWLEKFNLNIVINLGMYHKDFSTHVGYLKNGDNINNPKFNEYKSALLFNPSEKNLPYAIIIDLDNPNEKEMVNKYKTIVQNLRLIKGKGVNVWKKTGSLWPEAGIASDTNGNLLIFFTTTPVIMFELNEILLKLPLNIVKAFHTDGGPPASLSLHFKDFSLDLSGNTVSGEQEPIPNILGFRINN
ncbi:MAG: phosphodiester glycosidase family protein [Deltaproteobacteria bacterium]|nr:phosphodiester glycosidase family protein [Deltaproteobacteria bacterium]